MYIPTVLFFFSPSFYLSISKPSEVLRVDTSNLREATALNTSHPVSSSYPVSTAPITSKSNREKKFHDEKIKNNDDDSGGDDLPPHDDKVDDENNNIKKKKNNNNKNTSEANLKRRHTQQSTEIKLPDAIPPENLRRTHYLSVVSEAPKLPNKEKINQASCWTISTWILTWWAPPFMLRAFGLRDRHMQQAWREKVALVQVIIALCAAVGFLTFGFNAAVCGRQPNRIRTNNVAPDQIIIAGRAYDLKTFRHPTPFTNIPGSGDLQEMGIGGKDLSFLFQTVNHNCKDILIPVEADDDKGNVMNYFPCVPIDLKNPAVNGTDNPERKGCHLSVKSRRSLRRLEVVGDVYYNWTDIQKPGTSLVAFSGNVLDLSRLNYLTPNIPLPLRIAQIFGPGSAFIGRDSTYWLSSTADRLKLGKCLTDILKVGVLDSKSTGCIISDIVLWVSLAVILGVVLIRFFLALIFGWCISWKLGSIREETADERRKRQDEVLQWEMNNVEDMHYPKTKSITSIDLPRPDVTLLTDDGRHSQTDNCGGSISVEINSTNGSNISTSSFSATRSLHFQQQLPPPQQYTPKNKRRFLPTTSRFTQPQSPAHGSRSAVFGSSFITPESPLRTCFTPSSPGHGQYSIDSQAHSVAHDTISNHHQQQQLQQDRYNFNFDLIHTFMVVTCYSEGEEGLRTTLDSLANTDYPASHKMLLVICDGIITGSGNGMSTPDIVLSMMKDDVMPRDQVRPASYVAIADGIKRHNMAKVYAGFYRYNDDTSKGATVPPEEQQHVPMVAIVKCGTEAESKEKKPGNRGKRDSQVILMNAMQKVYYAERMCSLEYQFCKAILKLTGYHPSRYETCLMVDADTKVYPDSLARMIACMARDPYIMGLCGETKIANKSDSWITAIQVFEYYISHHMSKAFESIFGGVTCLPGCFCMYRIIAPKGDRYVPIFCSSDIVEMYCENIVDTLHKKNLLLLGEDRYLTTLMLRTFPKRKMIFVPQAVCKTVVPDTFGVLLSQRRRWINSTVHNLLELVLIRDLCGTFCFSMQFVVFMELVGTVVLPAAISFTIYLIVISFFVTPVPIIPLMLLAAILGLPAVLIALTTRKMVYVGWMLVYLCSLPIWNFVLPAYAYWHFDDFSWGQTRQVQGGEEKREDHGRREGQFDSTGIIMRRFEDWAKQERKEMVEMRAKSSTLIRGYPSIYYGH
ncbi:chitin synthase-domain-containing protein [Halteromyces radiatus]|uniref:chitin synthase-domain-containing protein n=1 Tax=Halteromyces radiatus TaxID=101107 RepID=UPI00221F11E6|nr:chitin synthase-domain-containing protein [Halteromyces radiatus]KAI8099767.1 chitin synthase-domain-containing protein [Halteromyces radiatus]